MGHERLETWCVDLLAGKWGAKLGLSLYPEERTKKSCSVVAGMAVVTVSVGRSSVFDDSVDGLLVVIGSSDPSVRTALDVGGTDDCLPNVNVHKGA